MVSERMQRRLDAFLDEADEAASAQDWPRVVGAARAALAIDAENGDAQTFLKIAVANGVDDEAPAANALASTPAASPPASVAPAQPESFVGGRYHVR